MVSLSDESEQVAINNNLIFGDGRRKMGVVPTIYFNDKVRARTNA